MGRPERPITSPRTQEAAALALWLRSWRRRAGLTYVELAGSVGMRPTTLSRAASGQTVPAWKVVEAYARGCGATDKEVTRRGRVLWRAARQAEHPEPPQAPPLHIALVNTLGELRSEMVRLHYQVGHPSLRELEQRAGEHGQLPRSTLSLVLRGSRPPSRSLLEHFLHACGVAPANIVHWLQAWDRAHAPQRLWTEPPGDRLHGGWSPDR